MWSEQDKLITLAFREYEDGLCSGCGQPRDRAYHGAGSGYFDRRTIQCAGCATLGAKHDEQRSPGDKDYLEWVDLSAAGQGAGGEHGHHGGHATPDEHAHDKRA